MGMTDKSKTYERATKRLNIGSVIEYTYASDIISLKKERAYGMIVKIDWQPSHARTKVHVITHTSLGMLVVDICNVCRVIII